MPDDRNCLSCIHCIFDFGTPAWSDMTPGDDPEIACLRGLWPNGNPNSRNMPDKLNLGEMLDTAKTCPQYEPEDWAKKDEVR